MSASIQERVAKGAAWLDEVRPGWRDAINLDALDIGSSCDCVCGHVFAADTDCDSGFGFALDNLGIAGIDRDLGFIWSPAVPEERDAEVAALTAEWRRVIHATRVPAEVLA